MKPIAIYYPEFNYINENIINNDINFIDRKNTTEIILNKIRLAKNHGIYGFAINYIYEMNTTNNYDEIINIFLTIKQFHFLLNWNNSNLNNTINEIKNNSLTYNKSLKIVLENFIKRIKKYLISKIYIKFKEKPILSLENPLIFRNPPKALLILRRKIEENKIGRIFIICPFNKIINHTNYINLFDAIYDSPNIDVLENGNNSQEILIYSGLIYKNLFLNQMKKTILMFRCSMPIIERNNSNENSLQEYTSEKYYLLNNIIMNWTYINYNITKGIFFIKSWNDFENGNYLEPDNIFGYASINSFSKSLFNLPFHSEHYNFNYLYNRCIIAIQAHVFYKELLFDILNKTNNIPLKFDLYITASTTGDLDLFEESIKKYSKASKFEILYTNNKGRDVLPMIQQMKYKIKKYKYICHIHTKKTNHISISGDGWRNYLFENLLGDTERISRILFEFENTKELGFIFPEPYFSVIKYQKNFDTINFKYHEPNIKYMNFVLNNIFKGFKIGQKLIFPVGDMFWAKIKAIHQIFNIKFKNLFPKEKGQINQTIMHAIERIWLYLVKKNGYYYKIIFNHY